jgi:Fe2+ or Zn2+ uptake regulation protein
MSTTEDVSTFLKTLTRPPQLKVLASLIQKPTEEFTKTEIASRSGIGRTTLYRIWEDLEKMKAVSASRQVGAVTLYRLNSDSPVVQSLLSVRERLEKIQEAVEEIEELQKTEKNARAQPQGQIPSGPSILLRLLDMNATTPERAVSEKDIKLDRNEIGILRNLVESGLVEDKDRRYSLTSLGKVTAEGAARLWRRESKESIDEILSSLKVALGIVSQEMKKINHKLSRDRQRSTLVR